MLDTRIYRPVYFPNSFARRASRGNDLWYSAYSPPIPNHPSSIWLNLAWGKASTVDDWITLLTVATAWLNRRQPPTNRLTISGGGGKWWWCWASGEKEGEESLPGGCIRSLLFLSFGLGFRAKSYVSGNVWSDGYPLYIGCSMSFKGEGGWNLIYSFVSFKVFCGFLGLIEVLLVVKR